MVQLSEKQLILVFLLSGVGFSGLAFGGVYYTKGLITEEREKITAVERKIKEAEAKKARIPRDEEGVIVLRENLSEYVKILPEAAELTDFARTVTSFAQASGVALSSMTPVPHRGARGSAFSNFTYKLNFKGTLWQFMKFMNLFESYKRFVRITSIKLDAGKAEKGSNADPVHRIAMTIQTFVYNKSAGGRKPVKIPQYDKKRKRLREKILRERASINIENYTFKGARSRRDVFVDPRSEKVQDDNLHGIPRKEQERILNSLISEVHEIQRLRKEASQTKVILIRYELRRKARKLIETTRKRVDEVREKDLITNPSLSYRFQKEVVDVLETFDKAPKPKDTGLSMETLTSVERFMIDALYDGRLEDAIDRYIDVQQGLVFKRGDPRREKADRIRDLYRKAKIGQEFSRLPLKITGTIVMDGGLSTAIINGKTYQEGDVIDEDLFLRRVGEEWCEFIYKGVTLRKKTR